jgi:predicted RNA-binding protein YlqC (UPF0109 family)
MPEYRDLVDYIVRSLVDHPDDVEVTEQSRGRSPRIEVRLHPEDVGRVIGKSGRNIEAVRALVKAAAIRDHRRVSVEVITEDEDERNVEHEAELRAAGELGAAVEAPQPEPESWQPEAVQAGAPEEAEQGHD